MPDPASAAAPVPAPAAERSPGRTFTVGSGSATLARGDALDAYSTWPTPATIVSDGAYGVGGFPGDPREVVELPAWYEPHVAARDARAHLSTTLWFWNTEIGWATVHPLLARHGFEYVETIVWDKGIGHVAGNVNGQTIRRFPVVTEVCALYRRKPQVVTAGGRMSIRDWLRHEWRRAGLALSTANKACGVKSAATRKYLTRDWLWYWPPPAMMARLVGYANEHGPGEGAPYFSLDGAAPVTEAEWASLRSVWRHRHGVTNVWSLPPLHGKERYKGNGVRSAPRTHSRGRNAAVHLNQKPLRFMRRALRASTRPSDIVWEPFGGLCSAAVAALELGRRAFAAESAPRFANLAEDRLRHTAESLNPCSRPMTDGGGVA